MNRAVPQTHRSAHTRWRRPAVVAIAVIGVVLALGPSTAGAAASKNPYSALYVKGVGKIRAHSGGASAVIDAKDRLHILSAADFPVNKPSTTEQYEVRSLKTGRTTHSALTFTHPEYGPFGLGLLPGGNEVVTYVVGCSVIYTSRTPAADPKLKEPVSTGITGDYCGGEEDSDNEDHYLYGVVTLSATKIGLLVENLTTDTPTLQLYAGVPGQKFTLINDATPGASGDPSFSYAALYGSDLSHLKVLLVGEGANAGALYVSHLASDGTWSTPSPVIDTPSSTGGYSYLYDGAVVNHGALSVLFLRFRDNKRKQNAGMYSAIAGSAGSPGKLTRVPDTGPRTYTLGEVAGPHRQVYLLLGGSSRGLIEDTQGAHGWTSRGAVVRNRHYTDGFLVPRHDGKAPLVAYFAGGISP